MLNIIKNSSLVGQSIISYVAGKGYPEIALKFVQDEVTKFELALECGDLAVALESAQSLAKKEIWERLATVAAKLGNHKVINHLLDSRCRGLLDGPDRREMLPAEQVL